MKILPYFNFIIHEEKPWCCPELYYMEKWNEDSIVIINGKFTSEDRYNIRHPLDSDYLDEIEKDTKAVILIGRYEDSIDNENLRLSKNTVFGGGKAVRIRKRIYGMIPGELYTVEDRKILYLKTENLSFSLEKFKKEHPDENTEDIFIVIGGEIRQSGKDLFRDYEKSAVPWLEHKNVFYTDSEKNTRYTGSGSFYGNRNPNWKSDDYYEKDENGKPVVFQEYAFRKIKAYRGETHIGSLGLPTWDERYLDTVCNDEYSGSSYDPNNLYDHYEAGEKKKYDTDRYTVIEEVSCLPAKGCIRSFKSNIAEKRRKEEKRKARGLSFMIPVFAILILVIFFMSTIG